MLRTSLPLVTWLLASLALAGCVGRTTAAGSTDGGGQGTGGEGGSCVDIVLSSYDVSCHTDSDCITISSGEICPGACACGGSTVNVSEQGRYQSQLSSVQLGVCGCPEEGVPQCLDGVCTICRGLPTDPPSCGTSTVDAGADGPVCVNVDISTYDRSCQSASDCSVITPGTLCAGQCACGGAAINSSGLGRYQTTLAALGSATECPCAALGVVACIQNTCTICGDGSSQTPACPDGF